ncbi:hypothetical protein O6H91_06G055900 [Diphasiastrum complanatum]|uniref:Uncharacterized protein n=5 Tax=Diphasiastrum complanatum TaxID=34168 RepID=A0ACC2CZM0_DIPCM|nr:hypothetical protein O6H91_08G085600 [Diphasiastrum complanatum]KAJ7547426.1 hypothetical protein O6H91_08G085600 [Diphasiastrum complanatum]KAJ7547427.1 hypothetical protein O6H91_08G085600 [Diphasiastrum complanatum]KAJ7552452.1 hypothetical protein O6H91_06G055900 [Diphasiastrum complanatum]KAJ7552454.1 hypothetical protein O6H91_06G055900 [Diphasiastrum complanatum]
MWAASCLASCCASCACEACKGVARGISRRSARIAYCGLFTLSLLLAWLLRDFAGPLLEKIPWINTFTHTPSKEWFGTQAVLRVSFGNFLFFAIFALLMIGVKNQSDQRDSWHHDGWMVKFILWCTLIILMFFLPNGVLNVYGQVSRFGSGLFLLVQVVILLDFTHNWNEAWVAKDEQFWYIALLVVSLFCYLASFVVSGFLFHWFTPTGHDCQLNLFFIITTLVLVLGFAIISLHPQVNGSLLPAAVIALYCTYICYSALSSEPHNYECNGLHNHVKAVSIGTLVMGMLTTLLSVVYSAVRAGSSTTFLSPPSSPRAGSGKPLLVKDDIESVHDNDDDHKGLSKGKKDGPVTYVYSFFHLIFALASMYSAMLLTGWGNSSGGADVIDVGWPSVWVRFCTLLFTSFLYIWSLVAPLVMPDRDFS